jgi:dihydroorotate dehydrogenase (NAD+) catalytic subunit
MLASGTIGYGPEYEGIIDFEATGAIVTKTITLEPREGNAPPRLVETPGGLLNAIGLENVGLERFLAEKLPEAARLPVPLVASVAGIGPAQFGQLAAAVGEQDEVSAIELNISCPNVERPRNPVWSDPMAVGEIVSAAREATGKTLILKLSPNTSNILSVAEAAERAGVDALTVANTLPGMRIDIERRRPALGNVTGGLSGAALLPVNLALVWKVAGQVSIPVIGSGGIGDTSDALEFLAAGAVAVQVGTALFAKPATPSEIAEGLRNYMKENDFASIDELVGMAREEKRACAETA